MGLLDFCDTLFPMSENNTQNENEAPIGKEFSQDAPAAATQDAPAAEKTAEEKAAEHWAS
jgi:hypothetical protein